MLAPLSPPTRWQRSERHNDQGEPQPPTANVAGTENMSEPTTEQIGDAWRQLCSSALLAALDELEAQSQADHPDETVQWAINELSDEGHDYLFGPRRKVLDAYKAWKAANVKLSGSRGEETQQQTDQP
jgi:hypothetical protein